MMVVELNPGGCWPRCEAIRSVACHWPRGHANGSKSQQFFAVRPLKVFSLTLTRCLYANIYAEIVT